MPHHRARHTPLGHWEVVRRVVEERETVWERVRRWRHASPQDQGSLGCLTERSSRPQRPAASRPPRRRGALPQPVRVPLGTGLESVAVAAPTGANTAFQCESKACVPPLLLRAGTEAAGPSASNAAALAGAPPAAGAWHADGAWRVSHGLRMKAGQQAAASPARRRFTCSSRLPFGC